MDFLLPKISKILTASDGVKCLLFDTFTKSSISSLIPHSHFLNNDYFLFDDIQNTRKKVNINCVCVLSISSIKNLIQEISNPSYRTYTVLFTTTIDPYLLNLLAKNDIYGVIREIHEIYMDFCKQDSYLFTLNNINNFIYSLGSKPTFYHYKQNYEDVVKDPFIDLNSEGGRVFVINRSYDNITPLIIDWHYQAMIKKYCNYNDGLVKIYDNTYCMDDDFFQNNKFKNISEVSTNIELMVKELDKKKRIKKINIKEIEEINKLGDIVKKHMDIYNCIINNLEEKKQLSENENLMLKKFKKGELSFNNFNENIKDLNKCVNINLLNILKSTDKKLKFDFKKQEDIKLAYVPPICKIAKDILKGKMDDWICLDERFNKSKYTVFYFKGGVTYTEYRHIMIYFKEHKNVYVVSESITS
ncbi:vacuolar protein sorting-associated protein [Vairimorpha ceranae]|uniref:Vacuolar protein sorting-associated protein n=1 Tax=Vairimorpha ceranae TaxID=40302 RepID=A0A0F9ZCF1_9MICR|nr:vacuolar protein sorting-associated protein [Vairimorpha ceranae]KAF5141453.1 hypothetical protein G9O61_00g003160 [Vairimorpha ceranae]KKO75319.1 vacuolar protein sorting-associated protein [Vairimorpha ceranae]